MLNVMNMIWAFNFSLAVDVNTGLEIPVDIWNYEKVRLRHCFSSSLPLMAIKGIVGVPRPFQCQIVPRSQVRAELIEREFSEAADAFAPFDGGLQ